VKNNLKYKTIMFKYYNLMDPIEIGMKGCNFLRFACNTVLIKSKISN
jgi:hypothetical protein